MKVTPTAIADVLVIEPTVHGDSRGFFLESFNQKTFEQVTGVPAHFVQDNHSRSMRGVLRGLHYQVSPAAQGKLVRVTHGSVYDVALDIRVGSPSFGRWVAIELSGENHRQLWIPAGFAHGFAVTSESADFLYKTTDYYTPSAERCIRWDDPDLAIAWPDVGVPFRLSPKDSAAPTWATVKHAPQA